MEFVTGPVWVPDFEDSQAEAETQAKACATDELGIRYRGPTLEGLFGLIEDDSLFLGE
jgi:hypothetical protein